MIHSIEGLHKKSYIYRKRFLDIFSAIGFGHLTTAFSSVEILSVLYNEILTNPEAEFDNRESDKVFISKGHGIGIIYPILEDLDILTNEQISDSIKIGGDSSLIKNYVMPGFDFYGGSLGIGLGMAAGYALGNKLTGIDYKTFCLCGDAECYEGSIWEAVEFAGNYNLKNLIVIIDRNKLGCSDFTEHMLRLNPLKNKWEAFNWEVFECNGHDILNLYNTFEQAISSDKDSPKCIIANTQKGKGLDYLIDKPLMHGYMPKGDDIKIAYETLRNEYDE